MHNLQKVANLGFLQGHKITLHYHSSLYIIKPIKEALMLSLLRLVWKKLPYLCSFLCLEACDSVSHRIKSLVNYSVTKEVKYEKGDVRCQ